MATKSGKATLLFLTAGYILTEIIFSYILVFKTGDVDVFDELIRVSIVLILILLYTKKLRWARWILSVLLIFYGLICLLIGFDLSSIFFAIGVFDIFFGIYIHTSDALSIYRHQKSSDEDEQIKDTTPPMPDGHAYQYPTLVRRYIALFIDGILIFSLLIMVMLLVEHSPLRTPLMLSIGGFILLTYEPFLTTYSKTLGQRLMKLRVGSCDNPMQKINLIRAYIRWFTKGMLGWISFITVVFNPQRRAIHDYASDSVMIREPKEK